MLQNDQSLVQVVLKNRQSELGITSESGPDVKDDYRSVNPHSDSDNAGKEKCEIEIQLFDNRFVCKSF